MKPMAYRHLKVTRIDSEDGSKKRYSNLTAFSKVCTVRAGGRYECETTKVRCLKDGGGLATVKVTPLGVTGSSSRWLLHFNSCALLKRYLSARTYDSR